MDWISQKRIRTSGPTEASPLKQREAKLDVCGWASGAGDLDTLAALGAGAAFSS